MTIGIIIIAVSLATLLILMFSIYLMMQLPEFLEMFYEHKQEMQQLKIRELELKLEMLDKQKVQPKHDFSEDVYCRQCEYQEGYPEQLM
jgi:hypothetical protein